MSDTPSTQLPASPSPAVETRGARLYKEAQALQKDDLWNDFDEYPRTDWKYEVANGDTNLGYWEWVFHRIEAESA